MLCTNAQLPLDGYDKSRVSNLDPVKKQGTTHRSLTPPDAIRLSMVPPMRSSVKLEEPEVPIAQSTLCEASVTKSDAALDQLKPKPTAYPGEEYVIDGFSVRSFESSEELSAFVEFTEGAPPPARPHTSRMQFQVQEKEPAGPRPRHSIKRCLPNRASESGSPKAPRLFIDLGEDEDDDEEGDNDDDDNTGKKRPAGLDQVDAVIVEETPRSPPPLSPSTVSQEEDDKLGSPEHKQTRNCSSADQVLERPAPSGASALRTASLPLPDPNKAEANSHRLSIVGSSHSEGALPTGTEREERKAEVDTRVNSFWRSMQRSPVEAQRTASSWKTSTPLLRPAIARPTPILPPQNEQPAHGVTVQRRYSLGPTEMPLNLSLKAPAPTTTRRRSKSRPSAPPLPVVRPRLPVPPYRLSRALFDSPETKPRGRRNMKHVAIARWILKSATGRMDAMPLKANVQFAIRPVPQSLAQAGIVRPPPRLSGLPMHFERPLCPPEAPMWSRSPASPFPPSAKAANPLSMRPPQLPPVQDPFLVHLMHQFLAHQAQQQQQQQHPFQQHSVSPGQEAMAKPMQQCMSEMIQALASQNYFQHQSQFSAPPPPQQQQQPYTRRPLLPAMPRPPLAQSQPLRPADMSKLRYPPYMAPFQGGAL